MKSKGSAHVQHMRLVSPPHGTLGAVQKPIAERFQAIECHWREGGAGERKGPDAGGCRGNHIERPSLSQYQVLASCYRTPAAGP